MSYTYPPPSPPSTATITILQPQYTTSDNGANAAEIINSDMSQQAPQSPSSSIVIIIIVIASAIIVSASIYILLRFFSRRRGQSSSFRSFSTPPPGEEALSRNRHIDHINNGSVFDSLPMFTFSSVTGNLTAGDCAVCLSKFEAQDQLRLLPLCCHAFHAHCIDTWLSSSLTCPLCRSSVRTADSAELSKIILEETARINSRNGISSDNGAAGSFRIEIGSISRRRGGTDSGRRSYSIGSFEYIMDDGYEVSVDSTHRRDHSSISIDKELPVHVATAAAPPGESLAREVAGSRSWLREYFDRIGSLSFRSSGRFNSRQSEVVVPVEEEMEEHRAGEEISELFRWLSGI